MFLEKKTGVKNLVSVSATFILVTGIRKEMVEAIKTAGASKDDKKSKSNKYLGNLTWVPYIQYSIIFQKIFMSVMALFNSGSEVNTFHPTFA